MQGDPGTGAALGEMALARERPLGSGHGLAGLLAGVADIHLAGATPPRPPSAPGRPLALLDVLAEYTGRAEMRAGCLLCLRDAARLVGAGRHRRRAAATGDGRPPPGLVLQNFLNFPNGAVRTAGAEPVRVEVWGRVPEVLKVSSKSSPNAVAGALAGVVRQAGAAELQVVGAGALNQAIKAVAIARGYLASSGIDLVCVPVFADVEIAGESRTAIRLLCEDSPRRQPPTVDLRARPAVAEREQSTT